MRGEQRDPRRHRRVPGSRQGQEGTVSPDALMVEFATNIVKALVGYLGSPDKVRAILDAEYAATDLAIDKLEEEKLADK